MENHPKPPPRPSISSKTASTQTSKSNHSSDALIELQVSLILHRVSARPKKKIKIAWILYSYIGLEILNVKKRIFSPKESFVWKIS